MKKVNFYSKQTGLSISVNQFEKEKKGYLIQTKKIVFKFFKLENNSQAINFVINGLEATELYLKIQDLVKADVRKEKDGKKIIQVLIHKYETKKEEITTILSIGKWFKNDKIGYQITIYRKNTNETINVPMTETHMIYIINLLREWSVEIAFENVKKVEKIKDNEEIIEDDVIDTPAIIDTDEDISVDFGVVDNDIF